MGSRQRKFRHEAYLRRKRKSRIEVAEQLGDRYDIVSGVNNTGPAHRRQQIEQEKTERWRRLNNEDDIDAGFESGLLNNPATRSQDVNLLLKYLTGGGILNKKQVQGMLMAIAKQMEPRDFAREYQLRKQNDPDFALIDPAQWDDRTVQQVHRDQQRAFALWLRQAQMAFVMDQSKTPKGKHVPQGPGQIVDGDVVDGKAEPVLPPVLSDAARDKILLTIRHQQEREERSGDEMQGDTTTGDDREQRPKKAQFAKTGGRKLKRPKSPRPHPKGDS